MLSKQEGLDQKQLAFITDRDKTSLTRLLATLERKKWIYRKKSLSDRRVKEVYITAEGSAILETALPLLFDFFEEMEAGISAEDILKTISVLERIQSNVTKMEEQTKSNEI